MGKVNIIKGGSIILQSGEGLKTEEVIPKSAFIIRKTSANSVQINLNGEKHMVLSISDITIQDGSQTTPKVLTPDNWNALTKDINDVTGGGVGSGDMLKSVYDTNDSGIVDTAENSLKLCGLSPSDFATTTDIELINNILPQKADVIDGKIPESLLPSYISATVEGNFSNYSANPTDFKDQSGNVVTPESNKIYFDLTHATSWRWGGSVYVNMDSGLALGETAETAYRGDRGKDSYDHSITSGNPHGTTKSDIGLSKVPDLDTTQAINNSHTHTNKNILDLITESFTTALKNAYDSAVSWITTNGAAIIDHISNIASHVTPTEKAQIASSHVHSIDGTIHVASIEKEKWNAKKTFCVKIVKSGLNVSIAKGATSNILQYVNLSTDATFNNVTLSDFSISNQGTSTALIKLLNVNSYVDYCFDVRLIGSIAGAGSREFFIDLQRFDNSVVDGKSIIKLTSTALDKRGEIIETFSTGSSDNYVTNGVKFIINNPSSGSDIITLTGFEILIKGRI